MSDVVSAEKAPREALSPLVLVDDDHVFRTRLGRALRERGLEVREAGDATAAAAACALEPLPRTMVLDLKLEGESGLAVLAKLGARVSSLRVLVLTGYGSIATAVQAVQLGARAYLPKPADADEILEALGRAPGSPLGEGLASVSASLPAPSLARAEWEHIQRVLEDSGGNISEAARRLGIARRTLQLKLKKNPPRI